jgi:hypothetical protein
MIGLSDVFARAGIDRNNTAIMLHTPKEPKFSSLLPWLAEHRRDLLEAYQATHSSPATRTLKKRATVVVFVGLGDGTLVLAGVWNNMGNHERPMAEIRALPAVKELIADFDIPFASPPETESCIWFDLQQTDRLAALRGRLRIKPEKMTQTYVRVAEKFPDDILSIERDSMLDPIMPDWKTITIDASQLRDVAKSMPVKWQEKLKEWRGIYLIIDVFDGARYVGAAYGNNANFLGRWLTHVKGEKGITKWLDARDPKNFRFSILERVLDDATVNDLSPLEQTWMIRLGTRHNDGWHGLNN